MGENVPLKILIVDDNEGSAKTLGWMMELLEHEVKLAHDGKSCLEAAASFRPDVVLLDIGLPGMSGYEVCSAMRDDSAYKDTVFIAQTGWGQSEHQQRSKEAGFHYHLVKPIKMDELQNLITSLEAVPAANRAAL